MNRSPRELCLGIILCSLSSMAGAAPLTVVNVNAADINCAFEPDCTFVVTEGATAFTFPGTTGTAKLQSRTFSAKSGTPTTIKQGYEYRLDLSQAITFVDSSCATGLEVDFGPVLKLQYDKVGALDDVFVVDKNGVGTIGLASAVQNASVITFTFAQPVCAGDGSRQGQSTFFFGLSSNNTATAVTAKVELATGDQAKARAVGPNH